MAGENQGTVLRGIERIFNQGSLTGLSEGQLLRRFAAGDEGAFEALVSRHGPMVRGVCRRSLEDSRDVEDAFQATFLVLLRKAGGLRDPEALGPWLYGVAYRVAARIRARGARRSAEERKVARPQIVQPECDLERDELRSSIDAEILRLPEKYRRPVVLCYLEGRTHEEAARRLRCSTGSVRGRLDRARRKLKDRLTRRGLAPAAGLAALAGGGEASAAVPVPLVAATVATLARAATATAVSGMASAPAFELADGVFRSMIVAKLKLAASFLAASAIILAVGTAWLMALGGSFAREGREGPAPAAARDDRPAQEPRDQQGKGQGPSIEFRVVDHRTGKPVPGVSVGRVSWKPVRSSTTDGDGRAVVHLPQPMLDRLSVAVYKDGFAKVTLWFPSPVREEELPRTYTVKVYPSETVGGVVRDEQGRPIAGVQVTPTVWTNSSEVRYVREDIGEPPPAITDAEGRWQCAGMPAGIDRGRVSIAFRHPDYQYLDWPTGQALENLRRGEAAVLPRGLELAVRVVNAGGRPIPGAKVTRRTDVSGHNVPRAETDGEGRFRFLHIPAGETVLTVQADGFAPAMEKVVVRPGLGPLEIRLSRGRTVRGRVVDARGEPMAGATVSVDGWRGLRTLDFVMTTDADGEFRWEDAPPDSFWVDVGREGYLQINHREVPPGAVELTFAMVKQLKVRGTVVDGETRHAIPTFTLVPGMERGGGSPPYWDRGRERPGRRGQFEVAFADSTGPQGRRLRFEADGYMPAVSRLIRDDEDDPVINVVLHRAAAISGVVHGPDGSPLSGADVVLVGTSQPAFLTNGRLPTGNDHRIVKTGGDGRFAFPPQEPPYSVVVLHDRGFAERTVRDGEAAPAAEFTIKPWGRIEGTLRIGRRPGAGQTLNLAYEWRRDPALGIPYWDGKATTDDAGRFAFERVMPGEVTVTREILLKQTASSQTIGHSHTTRVEVAPGATARLTMGGTGRPVVGKVKAPAGFAGPIDWTFSNNTMIPRMPIIGELIGAAVGKGPRRRGGGYTVKLDADGSFRVEDVEAGTYDLIIVVTDPPRDPFGAGLGRQPLATARREVVVPAMPGGRSDEPLDLGTISADVVEKPEAARPSRKP